MFGKAEFVRTNKALTAFSAVVAIALALGGCDDIAAQHAAPVRPVLVTSVHYEAQAPQRSFVGTVRPRIEADMGFRVGGKVSKRLVEVGAMVDTGQPLATLDEVDLKLQAEQADAEFSAATGVLAQASAAEARAKELRQKGWSTDAQLDQAKAAADEARARLKRAERSVDLTKNSLSYATLVADAPGVVTATLIEPGQVVAAGQTAIRVARLAEKEVVVAIPETLLARAKSGEARVSIWSEPDKLYVAKLRELAPSADPDDADLSGQVFHARSRRRCATRHDGDADPVRARQANASRVCRSRRCSTKARDRRCMSRTPRPARSRSSRSP